ncbi:hypothetical protein [Maribacter halichondriae]|uniref:hypothetical protein n=1 Tax=Maribacter halichondriae TaxID=2980554 RepID=UPI0023583599|nr:hypothetical protein [Maribacter sp. Hal144]
MVKNYAFLLLFVATGIPTLMYAQDIKIFRASDFDLISHVKKCLVRTNYGKEEYEFDQDSLLNKSVTRYSNQDYDITYYKYRNGELTEKRLEVYRDNTFDEATSIANFYSIDTTAGRKVTEKIVSYSKEFLDQYEYHYNENGKLFRIKRSNNEGTDETKIDFTEVKGEHTKTIHLNGVLNQSVRTSEKKEKDGSLQKIKLTKSFIDGNPNKAVEEIFNEAGKLISKINYYFDTKTSQFAPQISISYFYDDKGMLTKTETKSGETTKTKEYIYQFDETGNWVKEIITPDNAYKTREISYYQVEKPVEE